MQELNEPPIIQHLRNLQKSDGRFKAWKHWMIPGAKFRMNDGTQFGDKKIGEAPYHTNTLWEKQITQKEPPLFSKPCLGDLYQIKQITAWGWFDCQELGKAASLHSFRCELVAMQTPLKPIGVD